VYFPAIDACLVFNFADRWQPITAPKYPHCHSEFDLFFDLGNGAVFLKVKLHEAHS
jgi:hypothetical protein